MTKKRKLDPSAAAQCKHRAWIWMICIYDGRSSRSSLCRGRAEKEGKKNGHHPSRREKKKRRRGRTGQHNLPLKLVSKWNVPAQRLTKGEGPPYQMVVVVTSLSLDSHSLEFFCSKFFFFSPRFVTLKETFPSSSFGALRDDYTAGFFYFFFPTWVP